MSTAIRRALDQPQKIYSADGRALPLVAGHAESGTAEGRAWGETVAPPLLPTEGRHFVGDRHPRDPKGQWDEHGPGGTKSPDPIAAKPTTGKAKPGGPSGGSDKPATPPQAPRPRAGEQAPNGVKWRGFYGYGSFRVGDHVVSKSGESGPVVAVAVDTDGVIVGDGKGGNLAIKREDIELLAPVPPKPVSRPEAGDEAPNGGTWRAASNDEADYELGDLVHTETGVQGKLVGTSTLGAGSTKMTLVGSDGREHDFPIEALVMHAPRARLTFDQVIEQRRGQPRPGRITNIPPGDEIGGNGEAPYLLDLPPLLSGPAQVHAVVDRHKQFIPNLDKFTVTLVLTPEKMEEYDAARLARQGPPPARGLAWRLDDPPLSVATVVDSTIDKKDTVEREQLNGWTSITNARTEAEYTIAHELGHAVDYEMNEIDRWDAYAALADNLGLPTPSDADQTTLTAWVKEHKVVLSQKVSTYATTNARELLAEIWVEYALSTRDKPPYPWVKAVGDVMRKAVNK